MRIVDLSAPIAPTPEGVPGDAADRDRVSSITPRARLRSRRCSVCRRGCCVTAKDGRARTSPASVRTTPPMSMRPTTTTRRSLGGRRRRSTSCRSSCSSRPASFSTSPTKADGEAVTTEEMAAARRGQRPRRYGAATSCWSRTGSDAFYGAGRLHVPRSGRDRRARRDGCSSEGCG